MLEALFYLELIFWPECVASGSVLCHCVVRCRYKDDDTIMAKLKPWMTDVSLIIDHVAYRFDGMPCYVYFYVEALHEKVFVQLQSKLNFKQEKSAIYLYHDLKKKQKNIWLYLSDAATRKIGEMYKVKIVVNPVFTV